MCSTRRMSLNTSLKDARIFDEDSNDNEEMLALDSQKFERGLEVKTEDAEIKLEPAEVETEAVDSGVKKEAKEVKFDLQFPIKEEGLFDEQDDGGGISSAVAQMQLKTPIKNEATDDLGASEDLQSEHRQTLKSAKRSLLKQRNSPYSKEANTGYATRSTTQKNKTLYEQLKTTTRKLYSKPREEKDPEVLRRRQKQIDFGKNTTGYDNYIKAIPKRERTLQDPQTPNKRGIYSRRGFDGLIKQWRLQLHKYDP